MVIQDSRCLFPNSSIWDHLLSCKAVFISAEPRSYERTFFAVEPVLPTIAVKDDTSRIPFTWRIEVAIRRWVDKFIEAGSRPGGIFGDLGILWIIKNLILKTKC